MNAIDDLLAAAGRVEDATPEQLRYGAVSVRAAVSADPSAIPFTRRPRGRLHRRLTLTGVAAAAAAGAVTVSVLSLGPGHQTASGPGQPAGTGSGQPGVASPGQPGGYTTAATLLRAAGAAAGAQPGGWPDAAYWHVTSVYVSDGRTDHREIWIGHHATGVLRDTRVGPGVIPLGPALFPIGRGLTWEQLYALPTDPAKLGALLSGEVKGYGPDPNPTGGVSAVQEEFVEIGDLLRESPASPALRKALYDVAAGIPGVRLVGNQKDALGRTGVAVERNGEETLLIDPATGQLLAELGGNGYRTTYVSQGPASTAPAPTAKS
jgi:hypothetical protein